MIRLRFALFGLVTAMAVAACGGGGSTVATRAVPDVPANAGTAGNAKIFVPSGRTTSSRGARFVSSSGKSVKVTTNGGTPTFVDITSTSTACTAVTGGRACSVPLSAQPGAATFAFAIYDGVAGAGVLLGGGTATQTIVANTPFTVSVTLDAVVGSVAVTLPASAFVTGSAGTAAVSVIAKDPDGNTIVAPGNYTAPITLSNSDTTGAFKLSTTTVNGPSDVITLTYTGAPVAAPITITPVAAGLSGTALTPATVTASGVLPNSIKYTATATITSSYSYLNTPTPAPSTTPYPAPSPQVSTFTISHVVSSGATFGTYTNVYDDQVTAATSASPFTQDRFYALVPNASSQIYTFIGSSYKTTDSKGGTSTFLDRRNHAFAAIPFVDGASITADPSYMTTFTYSPAPAPSSSAAGSGYSYNATGDKAGNSTYQFITAYSTSNQVDNADGSGSITVNYSPGTSAYASLQGTVAPPAGGNVSVTIVQTPTSGSPVTTNLSIPVTMLYPNGVPQKNSLVTTVSTKTSALPSVCAVPASIVTGPLVTITYVSTSWMPSTAQVNTGTSVNYFLPGFGVLCQITDSTSSQVLNLNVLTSGTPTVANVTQYGTQSTSHLVIYVTGLTTSSHGRAAAGVSPQMPFPFLKTPAFFDSPPDPFGPRFANGTAHLEVPR